MFEANLNKQKQHKSEFLKYSLNLKSQTNVIMNDLKKTLISIAIWFGSGIISIILMYLITDVKGVVPLFIYFGLPNIVILAADGAHQGMGLIYSIFSLFKRKQKTNEELEAISQKSIGRLAISISLVLYGLGGSILGFFYSAHFKQNLITFLIVGLIWGIIVRYLFKKKIFDLEDYE